MNGDPCSGLQWHGVECSWRGTVSSLELKNNNLKGKIPPTIGDFSDLDGTFLLQGGVSGTIPSSLGKLTKMTNLGLNQNSFVGTLPTELARLTNLVDFEIAGNGGASAGLGGPLPSELARLTALSTFQVKNVGLRQGGARSEAPGWATGAQARNSRHSLRFR